MIPSNIKVGFCPTMKDFAMKIAEKNGFNSVNLGSAAQALIALNSGDIQIAIVGRIAKNNEFKGYKKRMGNGYTLISSAKGLINQEELPSLKIHTNVSREVVEEKYPGLKNVVYHESFKEALDEGAVQLISWDDWDDAFELLIPVDDQNNKNPKFRTPHIYSKENDLKNINI